MNYIKDEVPINNSLVFCKSVHGKYYAALFSIGSFYPYSHSISDVPIGQVEFWIYQD